MKTAFYKLYAVLAGVLLCGALLALKSPTAAKQYDYISIVQVRDGLHISGNRQEFEKIKFDDKNKFSDCNYEELFEKVNEFETQGYELAESQIYTLGEGAYSRNYVLLRKPRS